MPIDRYRPKKGDILGTFQSFDRDCGLLSCISTRLFYLNFKQRFQQARYAAKDQDQLAD